MAGIRNIDDAFKKNVVWLTSLYEFDVEGSPLYFHDGVGDLSWDSKTWKGLGGLIQDTGLSEDGSLSPNSVTFTLAAWIPELMVAARNETYIGRKCRKLVVPRNLASGNLVGTPVEVFSGEMGPIKGAPAEQNISLSATDERELLHRSIGAVFENAEFQTRDDQSGWLRRPASEEERGFLRGDIFFVDQKRERSKAPAVIRVRQ